MEMLAYRVGHWLARHRLRAVARPLELLMRLALGAHIPSTCEIGKGSRLAYGGAGVVLHPRVRVGEDCLISPGVVIGGRAGHEAVPVIGDRVKLYPGCKVLGPIVIGDDCEIGANAVVTRDLATGSVVVAPPMRILR